MELIRFFCVSASGVVLDIAIAYAVVSLLGAPLLLAATVGFMVAALGNYILHEVWTFRRAEAAKISSTRALYYLVSSGVTLLCRLAAVAWLSALIDRAYALQTLICGSVISFFVSFIISKFLVFSKCEPNRENS
jgi:putative flippase GtrA